MNILTIYEYKKKNSKVWNFQNMDWMELPSVLENLKPGGKWDAAGTFEAGRLQGCALDIFWPCLAYVGLWFLTLFVLMIGAKLKFLALRLVFRQAMETLQRELQTKEDSKWGHVKPVEDAPNSARWSSYVLMICSRTCSISFSNAGAGEGASRCLQ